METKLVPYSVYLPREYYDKIKELAKERKASSAVRDAIMMILDGGDTYKSGYNQGVRDSIKAVKKVESIRPIAIHGKYIDDIIVNQLEQLEMS